MADELNSYRLVKYDRKFLLQACHMNGGEVYKNYSTSLEEAEKGNWQEAYNALAKVIPEIHGHNFIVQVSASGKVDSNGYVIDDPLLEGIIKKWDNVNLSTLPEFGPNKVRATTENMAAILLNKIITTFNLYHCKVDVWETDAICATSEYNR